MVKWFTDLLMLPVFLMLSACDGGGGGGGSTTTTSSPSEPALSFQPLVGSGTAHPIMEIYNKDLNGDNVDEVIFAGRKTQPSTSADWQNFNIQIFGWNNDSFQNETSAWFSGTDNVIIGTDQAVKFGDFDGDGRIDFITTSATDDTTRSIYAQTVVFHQNTSGQFTRSVVTNQAYELWSHDLIVYDFNNDGRTDFLTSDYGAGTTMGFGNADDSFTLHKTNSASFSASGLSAANYLDNGTQYSQASVEIVMTDSGSGSSSEDDTRLFTWSVVDPATAGTMTLTDTGKAFPSTDVTNNHAIRNIAFDYDGDGDMDIVVFHRPLSAYNSAKVQFIKNDFAGGTFSVDSGVVTNFIGNDAGINYHPVLISIDATGNPDIFLTGTDFNDSYDSTQVLFNNDDGTFTGSYSSNFAAFWNEKKNETLNANSAGQTQQLVKGPSNNYYLVTSVLYDKDGTFRAGVYTKNLGTTIASGL